jgi:hypothetical protein
MAVSRFAGEVRVVFGQSVLHHRAVVVDDEDIVVECEHGEIPQVDDQLQVTALSGEVAVGYVRQVRREFTLSGSLVTITATRPRRRTFDPHNVEMLWAPRVGDPIQFSGYADAAFISVEGDSVVGLLASRIAHDADVESVWPTLAEVGRPWR